MARMGDHAAESDETDDVAADSSCMQFRAIWAAGRKNGWKRSGGSLFFALQGDL